MPVSVDDLYGQIYKNKKTAPNNWDIGNSPAPAPWTSPEYGQAQSLPNVPGELPANVSLPMHGVGLPAVQRDKSGKIIGPGPEGLLAQAQNEMALANADAQRAGKAVGSIPVVGPVGVGISQGAMDFGGMFNGGPNGSNANASQDIAQQYGEGAHFGTVGGLVSSFARMSTDVLPAMLSSDPTLGVGMLGAMHFGNKAVVSGTKAGLSGPGLAAYAGAHAMIGGLMGPFMKATGMLGPEAESAAGDAVSQAMSSVPRQIWNHAVSATGENFAMNMAASAADKVAGVDPSTWNFKQVVSLLGESAANAAMGLAVGKLRDADTTGYVKRKLTDWIKQLPPTITDPWRRQAPDVFKNIPEPESYPIAPDDLKAMQPGDQPPPAGFEPAGTDRSQHTGAILGENPIPLEHQQPTTAPHDIPGLAPEQPSVRAPAATEQRIQLEPEPQTDIPLQPAGAVSPPDEAAYRQWLNSQNPLPGNEPQLQQPDPSKIIPFRNPNDAIDALPMPPDPEIARLMGVQNNAPQGRTQQGDVQQQYQGVQQGQNIPQNQPEIRPGESAQAGGSSGVQTAQQELGFTGAQPETTIGLAPDPAFEGKPEDFNFGGNVAPPPGPPDSPEVIAAAHEDAVSQIHAAKMENWAWKEGARKAARGIWGNKGAIAMRKNRGGQDYASDSATTTKYDDRADQIVKDYAPAFSGQDVSDPGKAVFALVKAGRQPMPKRTDPDTQLEAKRMTGEIGGDKPLPPPTAAQQQMFSAIPTPLMFLPTERIAKTFFGAVEGAVKKTMPTLVSGGAYQTGKDVVGTEAGNQRAIDTFKSTYQAAHNAMNRESESDNIERIYRAQTNTLNPNDKLDAVMQAVQKMQGALRPELDRVKPGMTKDWGPEENYWRQQWKDPNAADQFLKAWDAKRPLAGSKSAFRQRELPTIKDGLAAGLEPATTNPLDFALDAYSQSIRFINASDLRQKMVDDGRLVFTKAGSTPPRDWVKIDDPLFRIRTPQGAEVGAYYAPPDVAAPIQNYLSKSLESTSPTAALFSDISHGLTAVNLGVSAYHALMSAKQAINTQIALGAKATFTPAEAARQYGEAAVAPLSYWFRGRQVQKAWVHPELATPAMQQIVNALEAGGGRAFASDTFSKQIRQAFHEGWQEGDVGKQLRNGLLVALDTLASPIMKNYVPKLKNAAFMKMMQFEFDRNPNMTPEEIQEKAYQIWRSVDARLGQVVQDNRLTNGVMKSVQNNLFRAFSYQAGTVELGAKAAVETLQQTKNLLTGKKADVTHNMAYWIGDFTTTAIGGYLIQKMLTGKNPENMKDLLFPQDGGKDKDGNPTRMRLPGYLNDVVSVAHDPTQAVNNKTNPLLGIISQLAHNKDYYGEQIYGEGGQGIGSYIEQAAKPYSLQNIEKQDQSGAGITAKALSLLGIGQAPGYIRQTPAQQLAAKFHVQSLGDEAMTAQQATRFRTRQALADQVRGKSPGAGQAIADAVQNQQITAADAKKIGMLANTPPFQQHLKNRTPDQLMQIWRVAHDDERQIVTPAAIKTITASRSLTAKQKQAYLSELGVGGN